jgi:tetratricopeptide (TPR) repeat protein
MSCIVSAIAVFSLATDPVMAKEQLAVSVTSEKPEVYLGEPLRIHVSVTNVSDHEVVLPVSWEVGYFRVRVKNRMSREYNYFSEPVSLKRERVVVLKKGESYGRMMELLELLGAERAGITTIEASLESTGRYRKGYDRKGEPTYGDCWKGRITSRALTVRVHELKQDDDVEALRILTGSKEKLDKGEFADIWRHKSGFLEGEDKRFQAVIEKYPKSIFAKHCAFALGRAYGQASAFWKQAIEWYSRTVADYPQFQFTDDAELEMAKLYLEQDRNYPGKGFKDKAIDHLQKVMEKYPASDSVAEAKTLLVKMKKDEPK